MLSLQPQNKQIQSEGTSSATYVNKNVINSDTPYINAKLQLSKKVPETPYEEMNMAEVHFVYWMFQSNHKILIIYLYCKILIKRF